MQFFAFDTETSGLDAYDGAEILEIAYILLDEKLNELARGNTYVLPSPGAVVPDFNVKLLNYSEERWRSLGAIEQPELGGWLKGKFSEHQVREARPLGHNVPFDVNFLAALARRDKEFAAARKQALHYHFVDTLALAYSIDNADGLVEKYNLPDLCVRYGVALDRVGDTHGAVPDIEAAVKLYRALVERIRGAHAPTKKEAFAASVKSAADRIRERIACNSAATAPVPSADGSQNNS